MPVTGDFEKLAKLREALARAGRPGAMAAAERAAKEVDKMMRGQFRRAEEPQGNAWAPRKKDGKKAYRNFKDRIPVRIIGTVTKVEMPQPFSFAQTGTRHMITRPFVPKEQRIEDLPERWRRRIYGSALWAVYRELKRQKEAAETERRFLSGGD